jgi:hypothetical protein
VSCNGKSNVELMSEGLGRSRKKFTHCTDASDTSQPEGIIVSPTQPINSMLWANERFEYEQRTELINNTTKTIDDATLLLNVTLTVVPRNGRKRGACVNRLGLDST